MDQIFKTAIKLKVLFQEMEDDLGITSLSEIEKNVLLAIAALQSDRDVAYTKDILSHQFVTYNSRPSVFRAIQKLERNRRIFKFLGKNGHYKLLDFSVQD